MSSWGILTRAKSPVIARWSVHAGLKARSPGLKVRGYTVDEASPDCFSYRAFT